jgi:hypothetical protein
MMALQTEVVYRYFLTDLLTNQVISEVPFKGVSFERANKRAGGFSGTIPFIEATKGIDLYEATMPGRTGLYVVRNNVCVWGGIVWSRSYDAASRNMSVEGAEFISYLYHRQIWQTIQYGSDFIGIPGFTISSGVATINTEIPHGFSVGDKVKITFTSILVDGIHTITAVNSANSFTFNTTSANGSATGIISGACRSLVDNYDFARDLIYRMSTDLGGLGFPNEAIKPGKEFQISIISKERSGGVVTLRTSSDHEVIPGQEIQIVEVGSSLDGIYTASEVPDARTIRYNLNGPDVPLTSLPGLRTINVVTKQLVDAVALLTLESPHGAAVGQTVIVNSIDSYFAGGLDTVFNGRFTVTGVPTANSFTFVSPGILNVPVESAKGGVATFGSKVIYGDYGSYTANSDISINFDSYAEPPFEDILSGFYQDTQIIRGFEQKTVGELLENYSNTTNGGFEYRIDCDYDFDTNQFTRTLWLSQTLFQDTADKKDYTPKDAGAENLYFVYPGNIISFSVEETAEDSATRFFVVGNIEDLTDDASQPYAAATAKYMLNNPNGRSWPLLDQVETRDKVESEESLYDYALDFLKESLPPIGTYNISVNGSLAPVVGTYNPGDWCTFSADDEFILQRLASDQEPLDDRLYRKINTIKVSVPDSPTFPETVELELITDWRGRDGK